MATYLKSFQLNPGDLDFLLEQVNHPTIKVVGYDGGGNALYGYYDHSGNKHTLGLLGTFDPLTVLYNNPSDSTDPLNNTFIYDSARDYRGLRNVDGMFNNLIGGQTSWGGTNELFLRLVNPDYSHYVQEVLNHAATTNAHMVTTAEVSNVSAVTTETVTTPQGDITYDWWTQDVTTTDATITIENHYHQLVNTVTTDSSSVTRTDTMISDSGGIHIGTQGIDGTAVIGHSEVLTGGELDTTTIIDGHAAHTFVGLTNGVNGTITNGVTTAADYSNPLASVVDYTPRMITQTVSSQAAMDRLDISTDTFTGERVIGVDGTGNDITETYTENFIENTNSYAADPSYSGWFVLFGQFFDHGLDFIQKPGDGPKIIIPLAVDDPLYGKPGPDGQPVTSITISRATPTMIDGVAQYQNTDSPYIDQNQTYGAIDQITDLMREWVVDPVTGQYKPGASLLDGHTVKESYISTVFSDAGTNGSGEGLTDRTLPTLNELRAHLAATGRADLSWEDISNYRMRDAHGQLLDTDSIAAGTQTKGTGQAILIDMLNRFDDAHIDQSAGGKLAALGATGITFNTYPNGVVDVMFTYTGDDSAEHTTSIYSPGNIDWSTTSITAADTHLKAILGELLLQSVGDHYIAGDGRANENFGLTTIHHVFHEDHNVQLVNLEATILGGQDVDPAKAHAWQVAVAGTDAQIAAHSGDIAANTDSYTGVSYHFQNLQVVNGHFEADITNIKDAKGNVIMDGASALVVHDVYTDASGHVSWNLDMMFNAAKLMVEMEYQHVAIDQYARFVTPDLPEFVTYDANINADISLEYAQAAFRFGHSQLRDTIDAIETQGADRSFDVTGTITKYALQMAFLNPGEFADVGPGAIALGMTHQVGNETDEFVTPALQQSLLGQPLDLAAINIARGRDLGVPTLNEVRTQLYDALVAERANADGPTAAAHAKIQLDLLSPYNSWSEFGNSMIHPESLVNFIAAYSFDGDVAHAQAVIDADASDADVDYIGSDGGSHTIVADLAHDFMAGTLNGSGDFAVEGAGGFNDIDLWIGGLAESHVLGGILGPTFNAIFEDQMERLMDGDRFYYLYRLFLALPEITNLSGQVTNEQFKDIVERTTGVRHLNGDIMLYADSYIELGYKANGAGNSFKTEHKYADLLAAHHTLGDLAAEQGIYSTGGNGTGGNGNLITVKDPEHAGQYLTFIRDFRPDSPVENSNGNPTYGYNSHEVLIGTAFNDYLDTGDGDDTAYGGDGNDIMVGNGGSDHLYGEAGNDIIYGAGGKAGADVADFLDGGDGNDIIYGGQNAGATEVLIGGNGNDRIYGEAGIDEIYGDNGDDYIDAGGDTDLAFGGEGNDELIGGEGPDELHGNRGDDLLSGGSGSDVLVGEEGDDILFGGQGGGVAQGDSDELIGGDLGGTDTGFDLANYSDSSIALDAAANLNNQQLQGTPGGVKYEPFNHLYQGIDGAVGSRFADVAAVDNTPDVNGDAVNPLGAGMIGDGTNNWFIGGSRNDVIDGRAGNDVIVGDSIYLAALNESLAAEYRHFLDLQVSRPGFLLGDANNMVDINTINASAFFGADSLYGGDGDDILIGGVGGTGSSNYDRLDGGAGSDWASYAGATSGVTVTLATTNAQNTIGAGWDRLLNIENLQGSNFNDTLTGSSGDNVLQGMLGNDTLNGGNGSDTASYALATVGVTVNLGIAGAQDTVAAGFDTLISIENLLGSAFNDTLTGNNSNNRLTGGAGNDAVNGSGGNDTFVATVGDGNDSYDGGSGTDTYDLSNTAAAATVNLLAGTATSSETGSDTLASIENVIGSAGNDILTGNVVANRLEGGLGNDTLDGGGGIDQLLGGDGNDTIVGDQADTSSGGLIDGGAGTDTMTVGVNFDDAIGSNNRLINIENIVLTAALTLDLSSQSDGFNITGSSGGDTVTASTGDDTINGGSGADVLNGNGGNDTINGGNDNDTINGGDGNDTLDGGSGIDSISGGAGDDIIIAVASDVLGGGLIDGGAGTGDSITVSSAFNVSAASDASITGVEIVNLTNNVLVNLTGQTEGFTINGVNSNGQADNITGGNGNDTINGNNGNDTLVGGLGADTLNGGNGNDNLYVDIADVTGGGAINGGGNTDTMYISSAFNAAGASNASIVSVENVVLTNNVLVNLTGQTEGFNITGSGGNDNITGGNGNDTINGGNGIDMLTGGLGADTLNGGASDDVFIYTNIADSTVATGGRDTIQGFSGAGVANGDVISLIAIDANTAIATDQAFAFSAVAAANSIWITHSGSGGSAVTYVYGDVNGNTTADFQIALQGNLTLLAGDFVL